MTSETVCAYIEDEKLSPNQLVSVAWSQGGVQHRCQGRIVNLNSRTATVELVSKGGYSAEFSAGDRIEIPRYGYRHRSLSRSSVSRTTERPFIHKDFL